MNRLTFFDKNRHLKIASLIIFAILLLDQILKVWIKTNMYLGEDIKITEWFRIHFIENNGMAFGMELGGEFGKMLLSSFRIVAVFAIGYYLYTLSKKESTPLGLTIAVSLIFAGALGNILDSAFYGLFFSESPEYMRTVATFLPESGGYASFLHGKVVDMFYFPLIKGVFPQWVPFWGGDDFVFFRPVFNLADSAITVGIGIIIIFQKRFFEEVESN